MSILGADRKHRLIQIRAAVVIVMTLLLFGFIGGALGSAEGEQPSKGWETTDYYKLMNFTLLVIVLFLLLRKPVSQAMNNRIKQIEDQFSELEAKKNEAEKELAEYNKKFLQLEQEAEKIIAEYVKQGNEAKQRILQEAETATHKLEEQARKNLEHEFEKAKLKLREEVLEQALDKAEKIIKNKITTEDQKRLVDEYLDKVVA
jgi:F-type H+-transporting ATPase subunit b